MWGGGGGEGGGRLERVLLVQVSLTAVLFTVPKRYLCCRFFLFIFSVVNKVSF